MARRVVRFFCGTFIVYNLAQIAFANPAQSQYNDELLIKTLSATYTFQIQTVSTPAEQATGLMHRNFMPENAAMLFDFSNKPARQYTMWMKNTYIALDMLFIDEHGAIVNIIKNTKPLSTQTLSYAQPVIAVLEINAGLCDKLDISVNDKIIHPIFKE